MLKEVFVRVGVHQTILISRHGDTIDREMRDMLHTESAINTAHRLSIASTTQADTCLGSSAEVPTVATDKLVLSCHLGASLSHTT